MRIPRVLVACEESQAVTIAMREVGIEAFSCDLQECSGGHPEWHYHGDATFYMEDPWDMIIAHPPCTYLSTAANRVWNAPGRAEKRAEAPAFFRIFADYPYCKHIAIENPQGHVNTAYRKPDQTIHPWMFGDPECKRTCLWLKGLPKLVPNEGATAPVHGERWANGKLKAFTERIPECKARQKIRSKTFPGIARAMAEQWGRALLEGRL